MPTIHIPGDGHLVAAVRDQRGIILGTPCSLALLFCVLSGTAFAENLNIKSGLWEWTTTTVVGVGFSADQRAEMEKALAQMPPEMRARAKAQMEGATKNAVTELAKPRRTCLTTGDISKSSALWDGARGHVGTCSLTIVKSTSSVREIREECSKAKDTMSSTERIFAPNPETLTVTMETTSHGGGTTATKDKCLTSGKWLGPECGKY